MGRLYISAVNKVDGPWLLGHDNLETLDNLFKEIDEKLSKALVKSIEKTAKRQMEEDNNTIELPKRIARLQRIHSKKSKSAEVTFEDGNTYETEDIQGILNYVDTNSTQAPAELYIRTIHGNIENEFSLIINSNVGKEEDEFEYRIRCVDEKIQQQIKTLIDKWIRENKSSRPLQLWSNSIIYFVWFVGIITLFVSSINLSHTSSKDESYKSEVKNEVQRIIENESTSTNTDSVLLLLLKLQSNYVPDNIKAETTVVYSKNALKIFIATLIILITSLIRPKTIIGIGKQYFRLKLYKAWVKITSATLLLLAGTLVADGFWDFISW